MSLPWVAKLEHEIEDYAKKINEIYSKEIKNIKGNQLPSVLKLAEENKQYDIYNSTTIEGYHITPEEVSAVISGKGKIGGNDPERIKNKMAIIGHEQAFKFIISQIKHDFKGPIISEALIMDIFSNLFEPSVEAKILSRFELVGYRKVPVYIRRSRYVPPSFTKVPDLMGCFASHINDISNAIVKSVLAHYFLVTIHPYPDGNGRCARLLMNYVLASSGYHWITVPANTRDEYFGTLQKGQVDGDILPFADFIIRLMKKK
ncbi:MAG: Fic family protein [Candidatus Margulisbacteria bacterium]|nr:Fic family protein [Candidatus Margulisiibacteriota bacterium]